MQTPSSDAPRGQHLEQVLAKEGLPRLEFAVVLATPGFEYDAMHCSSELTGLCLGNAGQASTKAKSAQMQ